MGDEYDAVSPQWGTYSCQNAIECVRKKLRPRRKLEEPVLPRDVVVVVRIEGAEELHAIHELRDACGDMMVAVEPDSTICDSFRSIY